MARVAPINLAYNPRTLWFHPGDLEIRKGDHVVVETARGIEFGTAADDIIEVSQKEIKSLKSPLKPVRRIATDEDVERAAEMEKRSREALPEFKAMVADSEVEMHPVSVEFLLDGDKAVFYFEAEERVDFRDLVRKLAAHFHVRIDMRQIGVRDEARIVGGLGHCGQELCCKRMGGDFNPVSIRMAKEQDLSLNPQKISGLCGRLMCCLRYEYDAYKDFKSRAPKANATVQTPDGPAKVVDLDVPREIVSLKLGDEKPVRVPLSAFLEPEEGTRPTAVGREGWDEALLNAAEGSHGEPATFLTSQFTGSDKLAEAGAVRRPASGRARKSAEPKGSSGKGRSSKSGQAKEKTQSGSGASSSDARKPRRRRSTKIAAGESAQGDTRSQGAKREASKPASESAEKTRRSRNRSHSVESQKTNSAASKEGSTRAKTGSKNGSGQKTAQKNSGGSRNASQKQARGSQPRSGKGAASRSDFDSRQRADKAPSRVEGAARPRPGQKSSGLARSAERMREAGADASGADGKASAGASTSHRRPRRRAQKPRSGEQPSANTGGSER